LSESSQDATQNSQISQIDSDLDVVEVKAEENKQSLLTMQPSLATHYTNLRNA